MKTGFSNQSSVISGRRAETRSVLECGRPLPLCPGYLALIAPPKSARGLAHSKTLRNFVASLLFLVTATIAHAQSYSIDWFKIAGGGGTSTGGVYSVSGTIGQPDAGGPMTGGNFSLAGGFWSLLSVVQTPGAPLLTITLTSTNTAMVSWPFPSTGFALQQNTNLNMTNWVSPSETVTNNGTINFIIVNPPGGNRFFRLSKP
jgi:hypothetical protein